MTVGHPGADGGPIGETCSAWCGPAPSENEWTAKRPAKIRLAQVARLRSKAVSEIFAALVKQAPGWCQILALQAPSSAARRLFITTPFLTPAPLAATAKQLPGRGSGQRVDR